MYVGTDFQNSDTQESEPYSFDFTNDLLPNETITAAVFDLAVVEGSDADVEDRLDGAATFDGNIATQRLSDLQGRTKYCLRCVVTTSLGNDLSLHSFVECGVV